MGTRNPQVEATDHVFKRHYHMPTTTVCELHYMYAIFVRET
jgi:hypothetical protein